MRKLALFVAALAAAAFAAPASAKEPTITTFTNAQFETTMSGVCSFDVTVTSVQSGTQIVFYDQTGQVTRVFVHAVETDTFTANGKTLMGMPFTFNIEIPIDSSGNATNVYASGVVERVVLPNGTLFLSAGRADFLAHPGVSFLLSPDKGNPGDVAAFCAALS